MKKIITLCLIMALSLGVYAQTKKIAVYVMGEGDMPYVVGNKMTDDLANNGQFVVSDRTASFSAALGKEQSYQRSGSVDETEIARLGKQYGVQYVCVVAILDIFNEKYFTARILNVEKAQVISSASSSGTIETLEQLTRACKGLSDNLLQSLQKSESPNAKKIAVYITQTGNKDIDIVLGDQLVAGFAKSSRYVAVERTNGFLKQLGVEQTYQKSGAVDDAQISKIGIQFGVQYVCVSETRKVLGSFNLYARIIDVEKNEIINSCQFDANSLTSAKDVVGIALKITSKLSGMTIQERLNAKVTDCQGHTYPIVEIDGQVWMAENLQCTKYDTQSERAGQTLQTLSGGHYAPYYTDGRYANTEYSGNLTQEQRNHLGLLYNWAAAMGYATVSQALNQTGSYSGRRQGICPNGWHLPNLSEWNTLAEYCGGKSNAGSKLKSRSGWYNGGNGTDDYGFSSLPAGEAIESSVYSVGKWGYFWSSDARSSDYAYNRNLNCNNSYLSEHDSFKNHAFSVRCLRD